MGGGASVSTKSDESADEESSSQDGEWVSATAAGAESEDGESKSAAHALRNSAKTRAREQTINKRFISSTFFH